MTWTLLRAAGIGAYVMLFLSVAWGLVSTTSFFGRRVSKATATTTHQYLSTCGLFLLAGHLVGLLLDTYVPFSVVDVAVPLASSYRPAAVPLGVVAMYAAVVVVVTSWLRKPIGARWWRRVHVLAVPAFVLSLAHGLFAGTDTIRPAMWWTYVATGVIVFFLLLLRGLTSGVRPERAAGPSRPHRSHAAA